MSEDAQISQQVRDERNKHVKPTDTKVYQVTPTRTSSANTHQHAPTRAEPETQKTKWVYLTKSVRDPEKNGHRDG